VYSGTDNTYQVNVGTYKCNRGTYRVDDGAVDLGASEGVVLVGTDY